MPRKFESFIDAFVQYTEGLMSTEPWRRWAAIGAICGALERKVWVYTLQSNLYPNQYIFMVGPAGAGKSAPNNIVYELWTRLGEHFHIAPTSASAQSFIDALRESERRVVRPTEVPDVIHFNALAASINELGTLITEYDNTFINNLTDIYDNKQFSERKRTSKLNYTLKAPIINMIASTTPAYLGSVMPEGAWEQGFMSRVIMVYGASSDLPPLFSESNRDMKFFDNLVEDLKAIHNLYGKMTFTKEAMEAITSWYNSRCPPVPQHPKLLGYNARRTAKLLKLCMVACVDKRDKLVIELEDYQRALSWLLSAEASMPEIFKSMVHGTQEQIIKELYYFAYERMARTKKPVPEHLLIEFLHKRVAAISIEPLLRQLVSAKIFSIELGEKNQKLYRPRAKRSHDDAE